jgi:hypothetical protein
MNGKSGSYHFRGGGAKYSVWVDRMFLLAAAACAFVMYVLTAHRTIDWWFGASYTLTAVTFGVHSPPGSLLLTLLGWLVAQLPLGLSKAFALNLFAGFLGTATCCLLMLLGLRLMRYREFNIASHTAAAFAIPLVGVLSGSLLFALSETMWRHSVIFMPYVLTALFTVLILWAAFAWWRCAGEGKGVRWLFLVMLLFGLDLSVHRTNLLLLPGFLLWVLINRPSAYRRGRSWAAGVVGLVVGLAFHLLIMPIAARDPSLNFGDPSTWPRLYEYLSLQQYGGSWLVNMWPRQGPFFGYQIGNYLRDFAGDFVSYGGVLAAVPLLFCLIGLATLLSRDPKLLAGLVLLFLCSSLGAVVYFNVPDQYQFPMDRHYLPSFVIFALVVSIGAGSTLRFLSEQAGRFRTLTVPLILIVALSMPVKQVVRNYHEVDGSKSYFGYDFARNILSTVQPEAIVIVQGDNYWPVYCLQNLEHVRPDVTVLSLSLLNAEWYVRQLSSRYPDLPLGFTDEELERLAPIPWQDTTIVTRVEGDPETYRLADGEVFAAGRISSEFAALPDSIALTVPPSIPEGFLLVQDQLLAGMIEENRWRRPIYFTFPLDWLHERLRLEGLVWLLVPQDPVTPNVDLLGENLRRRYSHRGYADTAVPVSSYTHTNGLNVQIAFYYLATYELQRGDTTACLETARMLRQLVPLDRIEPQPAVREAIDRLCR